MRIAPQTFTIELIHNWLHRPFREKLPSVLTVVGAVACLALATYWNEQIHSSSLQPGNLPSIAAAEKTGGGKGEGGSLFGGTPAELQEIRVAVRGIVRGGGQDAAVIAVSDGPTRLVRVGKAVASGWILAEIRARTIVLRRGNDQMEFQMGPAAVFPALKPADAAAGTAGRVTNVPRSSAS